MYNRKDSYYTKAKQEGFRARSSYKLLEIQQKYKIIKPTDSVLDIGCAPGSWLQVVKKLTRGYILGIDIVKIKPMRGINFIQEDINKFKIDKKFNTVLSDIAPKTTGIRHLDQEQSYELTEQSYEVAKKYLKYGGNFVVKTFQSENTQKLIRKMKPHFKLVKTFVPKSTRPSSKEIYIIALGNQHKS
ncbi:MAG: RlmE family RNA methyltransferase [archaeon]